MIATVILISLVVIVGIYIFNTQRSLVDLDEKANNAFKQISVQTTSRFDAVLTLVRQAEKFAGHEKGTLIDVISVRSGNPGSPAEVREMENQMGQAMRQIMVLQEQYPNLKSDQLFLEAMSTAKEYEEKVRLSRMIYNDSVTKINRMVRQWPSSFVAGLLKFGLREYLETDKQKEEYPPVN
ncbi:MAG: LemA family protein [Bacteroidales bacterium]|nr:LemA family protein [Bacteroidales bacterium]